MAERLRHLKKRSEFLRVAGQGRKWAMPGLVVQAAQRPLSEEEPEAMPRLGLTASKKVGGAVARNRAKRRLRALASELLPSHGRPGHDYVLIGRPATPGRDFGQLRQDLLTALERVHAPRRERRAAGDRQT